MIIDGLDRVKSCKGKYKWWIEQLEEIARDMWRLRRDDNKEV